MMPIMINDVPIDCINQAAINYHGPATLIISVMKQENGRNGDAIKNKQYLYLFFRNEWSTMSITLNYCQFLFFISKRRFECLKDLWRKQTWAGSWQAGVSESQASHSQPGARHAQTRNLSPDIDSFYATRNLLRARCWECGTSIS